MTRGDHRGADAAAHTAAEAELSIEPRTKTVTGRSMAAGCVAPRQLFGVRRMVRETILLSPRRRVRRLQSADRAGLSSPLKPSGAAGECLVSAAAIRRACASGVPHSTAPLQVLLVVEGKCASARARIAR